MTRSNKSIHNYQEHVYKNIINHAQRALKAYPDGINGFAECIGENPSTTRNQFNPNRPEQPTLYKFIRAIELAPCPVFMNAICALAGGSFIQNDDEQEPDYGLIESLTEFTTHLSSSVHENLVALADSRISQSEKVDILASLKETKKQITELEKALAKE